MLKPQINRWLNELNPPNWCACQYVRAATEQRLTTKEGQAMLQEEVTHYTRTMQSVQMSFCTCERSIQFSEGGGGSEKSGPEQEKVMKGVWIPEKETYTTINQFHIISLLWKWESYPVPFSIGRTNFINNFINTSVHKGRVVGMLGSLEHAGFWWQVTEPEKTWQSCSIENACSSPNLCGSKHYIQILCDMSETSSLTPVKMFW